MFGQMSGIAPPDSDHRISVSAMALIRQKAFRKSRNTHSLMASAICDNWVDSIMEFHDQIVLICGDADGLGPLIAESILRRGARTVVLTAETINAVAVDSRQEGQIICIPHDDLANILDRVHGIAQSNRIDVVINLVTLKARTSIDANAAALCDGVASRTGHVIDTTRDLLRMSQPRGTIVNVGRIVEGASNVRPAYASAMYGALQIITQSYAKELAPDIRINAVLLDGIAALSPANARSNAEGDKSTADDNKLGPILFLASSASRHMTGSVLTADAGRRLGFEAFSKQADEMIELTA